MFNFRHGSANQGEESSNDNPYPVAHREALEAVSVARGEIQETAYLPLKGIASSEKTTKTGVYPFLVLQTAGDSLEASWLKVARIRPGD